MIGDAMNGGVGREWWVYREWWVCREWWVLSRRDAEAIAAGDVHRGNPTMIGDAMNGWVGRYATPKPSPKVMSTVETPP